MTRRKQAPKYPPHRPRVAVFVLLRDGSRRVYPAWSRERAQELSELARRYLSPCRVEVRTVG